MKPRQQARQSSQANAGYALSALLLTIFLVSTAYGTYRLLSFGSTENKRRALLMAKLALARDTIIAYAAIDDKRPGRLLCPDLVGNGISPRLAGDDCPGYSGWLPWKTLDLADNGDDHGQAIRYVVSPLFGGDRNSPPLNSETLTKLSVDPPTGTASQGIAALLIAPRGLPDPRNSDGDDIYFNGRSSAPDDNDLVIAITRDQLMAATEQRIANQLRNCLAAHVRSESNLEKTYPWPAPIGKTWLQGNSGSLFGRFPDTQAGNPEAALQSSIAHLAAGKTLLQDTALQSINVESLKNLQQQAGHLRLLADRLYEIAVRLDTHAQQANAAFTQLDAKLANNPGAPDLPALLEAAKNALGLLIADLEDSGLDLFEHELMTLNGKLKTDIDKASATPSSTTLGNVLTSVKTLQSPLLSSAKTPNLELQQEIEANRQLAANAEQALNEAKSRLAQAPSALALAQGLIDSNTRLASDIRGLRIDLDPSELHYRARRITELSNTPTASGNSSPESELTRTLKATALLLELQTLPPLAPIQQARTALAAALASSGANAAESSEAASRLIQLAAWLEGLDENVSLETLRASHAAVLAASGSASLIANASLPLRAASAMALYWSTVATKQAGELARLARKSITAKSDSDTSAYTAARRFLDTLDGTTGTIELIEKFTRSPSTQNRDAAEHALAKSQADLGALLETANRLAGTLSTSHAKGAVPTLWFESACDFLQANDSSTSWWVTQGWKNFFFYQISSRIPPVSGTLSVNGQGAYPVIVLGAGQALPGRQDRARPGVAQFLERHNGHSSRDGLALEPIRDFSKAPLAADFNDQLAY